ncbi:MAG: crossover junction endodeoxyribonuclease RuvC [Thermodesulfobacteriota bacterium]
MVIMGVDPGSWKVGYGLIRVEGSRLQHLAHGVIKAGQAEVLLPQRLGKIYQGFLDLVGRYNPEAMAVEALFHSRNSKSALVLGHARGVIILAGVNAGLRVQEYTPLSVKQALTGYGSAHKEQVRFMVCAILGLAKPPPMDASDALAVAICHAHCSFGQAHRTGGT